MDGANFFLRNALGAASTFDRMGLPLLGHRMIEWYLGAFFFELLSAFDSLLHELGTIMTIN
jgi:hypothetical protein